MLNCRRSTKRRAVSQYEMTGSCRGCLEPVLYDSINRDRSKTRQIELLGTKMMNARKVATTCTCLTVGEERGVEYVISSLYIRIG